MVVLSGYPIARQLSSSLSISILCRPAKEAAVGAISRLVTSTPFLEDQSTPASWNPTTLCWTPGSEEASFTTPVVTERMQSAGITRRWIQLRVLLHKNKWNASPLNIS